MRKISLVTTVDISIAILKHVFKKNEKKINQSNRNPLEYSLMTKSGQSWTFCLSMEIVQSALNGFFPWQCLEEGLRGSSCECDSRQALGSRKSILTSCLPQITRLWLLWEAAETRGVMCRMKQLTLRTRHPHPTHFRGGVTSD